MRAPALVLVLPFLLACAATRLATLQGEFDDLYGPLAECYMEAGATADAVDVIRAGIAADSQAPRLYCLWGKILEQQSNYDGAISKFSKAAKSGEEPWCGYARKQIDRQVQHQKRADAMKSQGH